MSISRRSILILIAIAFLIRLLGITNPPIEKSHNWRQSLTSMVARNFDHTDILHPEIDYEGGKTIAMEFPFFSYMIHLFNAMFGFQHWYGRLINLIVSSIGLFFFYNIVRTLFEESHAYFSTTILAVSIFFDFSRKIMPDTFSVSLTIIGVSFLLTNLESENKSMKKFIPGMLFILAGILTKIPSAILITLLIPSLLNHRLSRINKLNLLLGFVPVFFIIYLWYGIHVPNLIKNGALQLYFTSGFYEGILLTFEHISGVLEKFYFSALSSYVFFALFVLGLIMLIIKKQKSLMQLFFISLFIFILFILKAAYFFYFHNYYVIPFVPIIAIVAGYGLKMIWEKQKRISQILLFIGALESLLNQQHNFFIPKDQKYKLSLSSLVNKSVAPNEKVVINSGQNPQLIYFANRKGWLIDQSFNPITKAGIDSLSGNQNPVIILDKHIPAEYSFDEFNVISSNDDFVFLKEK